MTRLTGTRIRNDVDIVVRSDWQLHAKTTRLVSGRGSHNREKQSPAVEPHLPRL